MTLNSTTKPILLQLIAVKARFLTPIPKATQTISDSVHGNLSSASVSVSSLFYTNTRSLVNKMDETEVILSQTDTQIFIVSGTWFHSELSDPDVNIPHHNLFTKSRQDKGGGGVAVYVKNDITASPINGIAIPEELECVWVMVRPNRLPHEVSAIAACAVYIPPDPLVTLQNLLVDHLLEASDFLRTSYPDIGFVIAGDFNKSRTDRLLFGNKLKQIVFLLGKMPF